MKRTLLSILLAVTVQLTFACTCSQFHSFCSTTFNQENDLIISGKIVYLDTLSIKISVIEIFKGQETNNTITIWNGTEFDCNNIFPMKANELGNVNDTIIVILPRITNENLENSWDVVGDYRRPIPLCFSPSLHVIGDSIIGMINNSGLSYPYWSFKKMLYNDFSQLWSNGQIDCTGLVSVHEELMKPQIDFVIFNQQIRISSNSNEEFNVQIIDIMGSHQNLGNYRGSISIPFGNRKPGVYIISINNSKSSVRKKITIN